MSLWLNVFAVENQLQRGFMAFSVHDGILEKRHDSNTITEKHMTQEMNIRLERIGTLKHDPQAAKHGSCWMLGCETLDRDFADFQKLELSARVGHSADPSSGRLGEDGKGKRKIRLLMAGPNCR